LAEALLGSHESLPACTSSGDERGPLILPLYHDSHYTFRFDDDRLIPRVDREGIETGRGVKGFRMNPGTGERLCLLATATVSEGAWVDLAQPIIVRAGEVFIAVPDPPTR
jgi:hypothetical protein